MHVQLFERGHRRFRKGRGLAVVVVLVSLGLSPRPVSAAGVPDLLQSVPTVNERTLNSAACGVAAATMVLDYYLPQSGSLKSKIDIHDVAKDVTDRWEIDGKTLIGHWAGSTFDDVQTGIEAASTDHNVGLNVPLKASWNQTNEIDWFSALQTELDHARPVIAFIPDGGRLWNDSWRYGHFIVISGYAADGTLTYHDPWLDVDTEPVGGNVHTISSAQFAKVWGTEWKGAKFDNPPWYFLTVSRDTRPGGVWAAPSNGQTVTNSMHLAAHAYPSKSGDPPIDHVNFTLWWPALGPQHGHWKPVCQPTAPSVGDLYTCDAGLNQVGAPPGDIWTSFDVYDRQGGSTLAPNGIHTVFNLPSGPCTHALGQHCAAIWTDQPLYHPGDPLRICHTVPAQSHVTITITLPDGTRELSTDVNDDGSGGCSTSTILNKLGLRQMHMDVYSTVSGKKVATANTSYDVEPVVTPGSGVEQETFTISPNHGPVGTVVQIVWTDDHGAPSSQGTVTFNGQNLQTFNTQDDGSWSGNITIPTGTSPGSYDIDVSDDDNSDQTQAFTVTP